MTVDQLTFSHHVQAMMQALNFSRKKNPYDPESKEGTMAQRGNTDSSGQPRF